MKGDAELHALIRVLSSGTYHLSHETHEEHLDRIYRMIQCPPLFFSDNMEVYEHEIESHRNKVKDYDKLAMRIGYQCLNDSSISVSIFPCDKDIIALSPHTFVYQSYRLNLDGEKSLRVGHIHLLTSEQVTYLQTSVEMMML